MRWILIVMSISILIILFGIAYGLVALGISGPPASTRLRSLGAKYLLYMLNPDTRYLRAMSPEGVTSILWDYRGLDTLYETMVLFTAIIGGIMIFSEYTHMNKRKKDMHGLSIIVRNVSKIIVWITLIVSVSLALTGQLTPGGGFVGGAAFAVVPVLIVVVYSISKAHQLGFTQKSALLIRTSFLALIITIILIPFFMGSYIFQNQIKPGTHFSYPGRFIDSTPLGGSLFFLNLFELFAVAGAFTLAFVLLGILMSYREGG